MAIICDPVTDSLAGVLVSTLRFAEKLKNRGHNIILLAARSAKSPRDDYHKDIKIYRFPSIPLPKSGGWHVAFPSSLAIKKIFIEHKIDIAHIMVPMPSAIVVIKAAKALGIKIVVHSHSQAENVTMSLPTRPLRFIVGFLFNKFLLWIHRQADVIVYPSELAKDLLGRFNKDKKDIIISNGIDTDIFREKALGDFISRFNIIQSSVKILFVGRLYPEKSIDTLINAVPYIVKKHQNLLIMIVGAGYLEPELKKLVKNLNIEKYVNFLGKISDEDLIKAYNACDIFVLPSLAELEGMVVLEAMACGKPIVIANAEVSASRYFVDGNGLLFEPKNSHDLAEKLETLIGDGELRKAMGEKSLANVKNYDINESIKKLENLYYSLL